MDNARKIARNAGAGIVVSVAALLAAPALASAASDGFDIVNQTGSTLTLQSIDQHGKQTFEVIDGIARKPHIGLTLAPNAPALDVELRNDGENLDATLVFTDATKNAFTVTLRTYRRNNAETFAACAVANRAGQCEIVNPGSRHESIRFFDPPGTTRTISGDDAQKQLGVLADLCKEGGRGDCSFEATKPPVPTFAKAATVGVPVVNCGDQDAKVDFEISHTEHSTNSVGVKVGGSVEWNVLIGKVIAKFEAAYAYKWGHDDEYKQTINWNLQSGHIGYVTLAAPIQRAYGTFTVEILNTTWVLNDVYFDAPDKTRLGTASPYVITDRVAKGDEERACADVKGIRKLDPSVVHAQSGGSGSNTLFSAAVGGRLSGEGGNDILVGAGGRDRLFGGAGDDVLLGADGRDWLSGGPGADTIVDISGPTTVRTGAGRATRAGADLVYVRDGRGDDVVRCDSPNSIVVADRDDRITGRCGTVTRTGPINQPPL